MTSPFNWKGQPSELAKDDKELKAASDGLTRAQRQTQIHVKAARAGKPITALNSRFSRRSKA